MSTFSSFSSFTSWFTAQPTGFSQSQLQLEKARDFSWRKGYDKRRWSDYRMLWGAVCSRAKDLTAAGSAADITNYADAAAALDLQHKMKPCTYFTQFLKKRGSRVAANGDSSSGEAGSSHGGRGEAAGGRSLRKRPAPQEAPEPPKKGRKKGT